MRRQGKLIAIILGMVLLMSSFSVMAAGTSSVSVSTNSPGVGDTFTVTATATESGKMSVKYNKEVLSVVNCDVSGYTSSPGEVEFNGKRGTITFKANAAGDSSISVSSDNASSSSMVINVGGSAAGAATEDFVYNGVKYTVSEKFSAEEVPGGFAVTQLTINGKNLKGVSNGAMTLVYLKPVDNIAGNGTFYIYDTASNSVKEYFFLGRPDYYVIPSTPTEMISDKLNKSTIDVDGRQVEVYTLSGVNDFVYVYGTNSNNVSGWYEYDTQEKTIQRANKAVFENNKTSAEPEKEEGIIDKLKSINIRYIIAGAIFLFIVIIAIVINVILKKKDDEADLIDGDENDFVESIDKKSAKEEIKRTKEEIKAEKKRAKKEAKEQKRQSKKQDYSSNDIEDDIYDEFDDFDIDKSIDDLKVGEESKSVEKSFDKKEPSTKKEPVVAKEDMMQEDEEDEGVAFWEDEKDIKKEKKKRKKENKKSKNIFGDDEIDLNAEFQAKMEKNKDADKSSSDEKRDSSGVIDFNDF